MSSAPEPDQADPHQWPGRQVERAQGLGVDELAEPGLRRLGRQVGGAGQDGGADRVGGAGQAGGADRVGGAGQTGGGGQVDGRYRDRAWWVDALHWAAVAGDQPGAQRFVPLGQGSQRGLERVHVQRAVEADRDRDVVHRLAGGEAVEEPELLLAERQRQVLELRVARFEGGRRGCAGRRPGFPQSQCQCGPLRVGQHGLDSLRCF